MLSHYNSKREREIYEGLNLDSQAFSLLLFYKLLTGKRHDSAVETFFGDSFSQLLTPQTAECETAVGEPGTLLGLPIGRHCYQYYFGQYMQTVNNSLLKIAATSFYADSHSNVCVEEPTHREKLFGGRSHKTSSIYSNVHIHKYLIIL